MSDPLIVPASTPNPSRWDTEQQPDAECNVSTDKEEDREAEFCDELKESTMLGSTFLIYWCFRRGLWEKPASVLPEAGRSSHRPKTRRLQIATAAILLLAALVAQVALFIGLAYGIHKGLSDYSKEGNANITHIDPFFFEAIQDLPLPEYMLKTYFKPYSLCPGRDDVDSVFYHTDENGTVLFSYPTTEDFVKENELVGSSSQDWVFTAAVAIILAMGILEFMATATNIFHLNNVRKAAMGHAADYPEKRVEFSVYENVLWNCPIISMFDQMLSAGLSVGLYCIAMVAMFYVGSVGKIITLMFGLQFLEQVDDMMKNSILKSTDMGPLIYHHFDRKNDRKGCCDGILIPLMGIVILCFYLAIPGVAAWLFWMLASGCKPGSPNEFGFF